MELKQIRKIVVNPKYEPPVGAVHLKGCLYQITWYSDISYKDLVVKLIRKKYSADDELAILRQRDTKPDEFSAYNDFVESCKSQAKAFVEEREAYKNQSVTES